MRESEQTQRMKSQVDLIPERRTVSSMSTTNNSNVPLMAMTPISASNSSNSSSAFFKDLTSTLFDPTSMSTSTQSLTGLSSSQTMPSLVRPTAPMTMQQPTSAPVRPTLNFSSTSNRTDLTSSLLNNINSLGSRSQATSTGVPMNTMNSSMPSPYFNAGPSNNGVVFQPPPPPGSTIMKGSIGSSNMTRSKTATSELDDLFN
jgi:hypothetical protein